MLAGEARVFVYVCGARLPPRLVLLPCPCAPTCLPCCACLAHLPAWHNVMALPLSLLRDQCDPVIPCAPTRQLDGRRNVRGPARWSTSARSTSARPTSRYATAAARRHRCRRRLLATACCCCYAPQPTATTSCAPRTAHARHRAAHWQAKAEQEQEGIGPGPGAQRDERVQEAQH